jgi:hypothetical protein
MQRRLTENEAYLLRMHVSFAESLKVTGINLDCEAAEQMIEHNTTDCRPYVEPELTDEDARQRPWVMVRDCVAVEWYGPAVFVDKLPNGGHACRTRCQDGINVWRYCRRATPEEIEAANANQAR